MGERKARSGSCREQVAASCVGTPATAARRALAAPAQARIGAAPRRRTPRPARRPSSACSGCSSSGSIVVDPLGAHPGALEQLGVAGQLGDAELGQPALAGPDQLPLAAQLEVDLGQAEAVGVVGQRLQPRRPLGAEQQAQRRRARRGRSALGAGAAGRSRSARRPRPASRWRWGRRSRPRSPRWRPARRRRRRRTRAITSCFSAGRSWPCMRTTRKSRSSPARRRSNSAVAARACSSSDSSTSGQTTNAWRPARSSSRIRS